MSNIQFSIVIAAKNEAEKLPVLFESLKKLNYPKEDFEIIFVNDQSTDNTKNLIDEFIKITPNAKIYDSFGKKYPGKKGALDIGISHAKYDYIMITDADCEPQPNWLKIFAQKFQEEYDFLFGIAPYKQTNSFVNKIATFDNLRLHIASFTAAKIGLPYSAAARNFGFKKDSFHEVSGYKNTTETLSGDDDLLLREAIKNKLRIGVVENLSAAVYSTTKTSWKDYLLQKARHSTTANYYLLKQKLVLAIWHLMNLGMLFSFFLGFINPFFFILFIVKLIADVIIVQKLQKKFGYSFSILESIYLQIVYEIMLIYNYFRGTFGERKWK